MATQCFALEVVTFMRRDENMNPGYPLFFVSIPIAILALCAPSMI